MVRPMMLYRTVVVDPPWPSPKAWQGKKERYSARDYKHLTIPQIRSLGIPDIAEADSHLYIWSIQSKDSHKKSLDTKMFLEHSFDLARHWGYRPMNLITWGKTGPGTGNYFQVNSEFILFAVRGSLPGLKTGEQRPTWFEASRLEPSEKPDEAYELIERVSPGPRIDIFARKPRGGWDVWGDEVDGVDLGPDFGPRMTL